MSRAHSAAPLMEAGQQGVIWLQNKYWRANSRGGHLPIAAKVAAIGLIKASRRYDDKRINNSKSNFIAYARPFVNGEITNYLRDKGFLITVPGRWRELYVRGQKLIREGTRAEKIPELLGITPTRWAEIVEACAVRVVAMNQIADEEEL